MFTKSKKKGLSLIEVIVALSIVAITFSATVTLIVQVVGLTLSARNRTEAVAIAQRELSKAVVGLSSGCSQEYYISTGTSADGRYKYEAKAALTRSEEDDGLFDFDYENDLNESNFVMIRAEVKWKERGDGADDYTGNYVLKHIVERI